MVDHKLVNFGLQLSVVVIYKDFESSKTALRVCGTQWSVKISDRSVYGLKKTL